MILYALYRGYEMTYEEVESNIGITTVGTDYGFCCKITPQLLKMAKY